MSLSTSIQSLANTGTLSGKDLESALQIILSGDAEPAAVGALLMGLETTGLKAEHIEAGARVLRQNMAVVPVDGPVLDTCGTGGDASGTYNISTAAAIVAASCGVKIAKHGNKSVSSKSGSSEVLSELGVNIDLAPDSVAKCINQTGIGFLYAPKHHSAMRHVAPVRAAMGIKTLFNLLGPLSNPARAPYQLLGVYDSKWCQPMAEALRGLGCSRAWVVHGSDGLDELTTTGQSQVCELNDGEISTFEVDPTRLGLANANLSDLKGGDAAYNAKAIKDMFNGGLEAYRDIVCLNAGATLVISGQVETLKDGIHSALSAVKSGAAKMKLDNLARVSQALK